MNRPFLTREPGGLLIAVRAAPKASRDAVLGVMATPDGSALKVAVTAAPDRGRATAAIVALLAKAFGVPKSAISVVAGATDRSKLLRVSGDPDALTRIAQQWIRP